MKVKFYIFSFLFFFIAVYISCSKAGVNIKKGGNNIINKVDSLELYYTNSIKRLPTNIQSIKHVDSFIKIANKQKLKFLVYKGFMVKTKLLSKLNKYQQAIEDTKVLLQLAITNNDSSYIGKANNKLGIYKEKLFNYEIAFQYYNKSFAIHRNLKDSILCTRRLMAMSRMQRTLGDYIASNITATDGLKYITNSSNLDLKLGLYHEISISFREQKNYQQALFWNDKIIDLLSVSKDYESIINYKNTKANIYRDLNYYDKSLSIFSSLLKDSLVMNNPLTYARILSNCGFCKWKKDKSNLESESMFLKALKIRSDDKDFVGLIASQNHLTKYYQKRDQKKALFHAKKAYLYAKKINNKVEVLNALDLITSIDSSALKEFKEYKLIDKSLKNTQRKLRQIYAPTRFENELLTKKAIKDKKIIEEKEKENKWILSIAVILITIAIIYFRQRQKFLKERNKSEKLQMRIDTEKEMSKRVHDNIANDIYLVKKLIQNSKDKNTITEKINKVYHKARDIARDNGDIDFNIFEEYLEEIINNYISKDVNVFEKGIDSIQWKKIDNDRKILVYQVIKELMVNMEKHSKATIVSIIFKQEKKKLLITYTDNGIGFIYKQLNNKNGIAIMENLITSFGGTINFENSITDGVKIFIKIPF